MKITVSQLRRIIKEEVQRSLRESGLPKKADLDPTLMSLAIYRKDKPYDKESSYIVSKDGLQYTITRTGDTEYTLKGPDGVQTFAPDFFMPGPMGQGLALNQLYKVLGVQ